MPSRPRSSRTTPSQSAGGAAESASIAQRTLVLIFGTLGSRVLGVGRDIVVAASFPTAMTDLWIVAFTLPNLLRSVLGEGAVDKAVMPVLSQVSNRDGKAAARAFYARLSLVWLMLMLAVSALGVVFAPFLAQPFVAGGDAGDRARLTLLIRVVFPYIGLMGMAALAVGALQYHRRFVVTALSPGLLNVALIAAALFLPRALEGLGWAPILALAIGALVGGLLQVAVLAGALRRIGFLPRPAFAAGDRDVRAVFRLMGPLLLGLGVYQLNVLLGRFFASTLGDGPQSYLYYGQRLVEIPQGVFAYAVASAVAPTLNDLRNRRMAVRPAAAAGQAADPDADGFVYTYLRAIRLVLFLALPASAGLFVLAEPAVTVLFGRGAFTRADVLLCAQSLVWQAVGVFAVASSRVTVTVFSAQHNTRAPVVASAVNLVVFVALTLGLIRPFGHVGIAAALSAAGIAQFAALLWLLRRQLPPDARAAARGGWRLVRSSVAKSAAASLGLAAAAFGVARQGDWARGGNDLGNLLWFALAVFAGAAAYGLLALLMRSPELAEARRLVGRRFAR